ncbi:hypothetical protein L1887_05880 [Cichorium endivia]|nr:hypothetical protein L1887_05880 [Cichorium endivia]
MTIFRFIFLYGSYLSGCLRTSRWRVLHLRLPRSERKFLKGLKHGGVDSTVAATLVHKAFGDRIHCAFVHNALFSFTAKAHIAEAAGFLCKVDVGIA